MPSFGSYRIDSDFVADAAVTAPVATTVNQCRLRGDVRICQGKKESVLPAGVKSFDDLQWVEHDGVRYEFSQPTRAAVSNTAQTGKRKCMSIENKAEILLYNTLVNNYVTVPTRYRRDLSSGLIGPVSVEISKPVVLSQ